MTTDHDVLKWLKDTRPDIYQRVLSMSGGSKKPTIEILIDILDKGSIAK